MPSSFERRLDRAFVFNGAKSDDVANQVGADLVTAASGYNMTAEQKADEAEKQRGLDVERAGSSGSGSPQSGSGGSK